ncbi:hypothetical protein COCMIDRAFT_5743 [Bipolaris oryzae ATCC 44560]|uniref:Uncharacterized protein n=1 Tax=Bipolaris oryzae ATCC 44560 TaxID=930090 RepID=W6ZC18_COCMI|nr:uncharacterized protein COCMIDRAFT_5743 [Bipolaris oryzae ATCC 44560]EUC44984.1 hypothetical protein COCMIDRAFT_5743 [Bipolaris oryzae ATCC 44560]
MFRLSKSRKEKAEKDFVDLCEPSRPRIINGLKKRASSTLRSVAIPQVVVRTPRHSVLKSAGPHFSDEAPYSDRRLTFSGHASRQFGHFQVDSDDGYQMPGYFHKSLPREVYDCIVAQLGPIHMDQEGACATCYLKDLHSLSLTSRAWGKAANAAMYRKALVLANEEHGAHPRLKIKGTSRLKLLRRTLRESPILAKQVKELHLPAFQNLYQNATIEQEEILNLVASLVMACPRLERLVGFHVPFTNAFDRLSYALSTRSNLKERTWILGNAENELNEEDEDEMRGHYIVECDPTEHFLNLNSNHPELSTLVLHQGPNNSSSPLNFRAIVGTLRSFPQLRHLSIRGLPATSFTNMVLNALPTNLRSLRLEALPGITEKGIQRFVTSPQATSIQKLTLVSMNISVHTLADILSPSLAGLEEFSLVQNKAPVLREHDTRPVFKSLSLRYLHWEFRSEASSLSASTFESPESSTSLSTNFEPSCCIATFILAAGIMNNEFPSLCHVRIPHDPQGTIQSLCKPLTTTLLPADISQLALAPRTASSDSLALGESFPTSVREDEMFNCAVGSETRVDSVVSLPRYGLPATNAAIGTVLTPMRSRIAAQARILAAKKEAGMMVRVIDPEDEIIVEKVFGSYIGDLRSKINYELQPDRRASGRTAWVTEMEDLMGCRVNHDGHGIECTWDLCGHTNSTSVDGKVVMVDDLF